MFGYKILQFVLALGLFHMDHFTCHQIKYTVATSKVVRVKRALHVDIIK